MYKYTKVVEVTVDEKEFIKYCEEWGMECPKTEEEMQKAISSYFEEWTERALWEVTHGYLEPRPFIKDYYENISAKKEM